MKYFLVFTLGVLIFPVAVFSQDVTPAKEKEISAAINELEAAENEASNMMTNKVIEPERAREVTERIGIAEDRIRSYKQEAIEPMTKLALDKSKGHLVRQEAMKILAGSKNEKVTDTFIKVAKDKNDEWYNRTAALHCWGTLIHELRGENINISKKYMNDLEMIFNDEHNKIEIRSYALGIYAQIGEHDALPVLVKKLDDPVPEIAADAVYGLGSTRTPESEDILIERFQMHKGGPYVHLFSSYKIKKAGPYVLQALKELNGKSIEISTIRGSYIKTLGELGERTAIPELRKIASTSSDLLSAEDAAIALAKMGDYSTIGNVIRRIEKEGRVGVGQAKSLRKAYKEIIGHDYTE